MKYFILMKEKGNPILQHATYNTIAAARRGYRRAKACNLYEEVFPIGSYETGAERYARRKEAARQTAIEWQARQAELNPSWREIAESGEYFAKLASRYGLIREFRENGII